MAETTTGKIVDGDIRKTGALQQIRRDKIIPPKNTPRPVGQQPK